MEKAAEQQAVGSSETQAQKVKQPKKESDALDQVIEELNEVRERQTGAPFSLGLTGLLKDIPVTVEVVLGKAKVSVADANSFQPGSTVKLDSHIGDEVTILVGGVAIGDGKIIISPEDPDFFAVQITNLFNDGGS